MKSRKFKWASPLFIIFLALAGVFSVTGAITAKQAEETPVVEKAEAAVTNKPGRIYVKVSTADLSLNDLYVYYFHGSTADGAGWPGTKVTQFTDRAGDTYGYVDVPNGNATSFIVNNNSGYQTNDITIHTSGNNLIDITAKTKSGYKYNSVYTPKTNLFLSIFNCIWAKSWSATLSNIHVYFFNSYGDCGSAWPGKTLTSFTLNTKTYGYCSIPSNATTMLINAWNGKDGDYDANKCRVANTPIPLTSENYYDINSNNSDWNTYQTFSQGHLEVRHLAPTSASTTTARVFINNTKYTCDDSWKNNVTLAVRAWGGSANGPVDGIDASTYVVEWFDGQGTDGKWYAFADIPTDVSGFQFVRMSGATVNDNVLAYSDAQTKDNSSFGKVYYLKATSSTSCPIQAGAADSVGTALLTKVLQSVNTCSNSYYNGYNLYSNLNTNFYNGGSLLTSSAKTSRYSTLSGGGSTYLADTIFTALYARQSHQSSAYNYLGHFSPLSLFGDSEDGFSTLIIIVASSVALLSVTALSILVIKKRKHKEE